MALHWGCTLAGWGASGGEGKELFCVTSLGDALTYSDGDAWERVTGMVPNEAERKRAKDGALGAPLACQPGRSRGESGRVTLCLCQVGFLVAVNGVLFLPWGTPLQLLPTGGERGGWTRRGAVLSSRACYWEWGAKALEPLLPF